MKCDKCGKEIIGLNYKFLADRPPERTKKEPWKKQEKKHFMARPFLDYFKSEEKDRLFCKECAVKEIFR